MMELQGKNVLVSGGENCLGMMVASRLAGLGAKVSLICDGHLSGCQENLNFIDRNRMDLIEELKDGPEVILYLDHPESVANTGIDSCFFNEHLPGLLKLLRLAAKNSSYFIYASSTAVYGKQKYLPIDEGHPVEPVLLYGSVKLAGEFFCRSMAMENGFFYTILRYGDLYGPGLDLSEPSALLKKAVGGRTLFINGSGSQVCSYLFIEDAVEATIKSINSKPINQIINIAGNEYISMRNLASLVKEGYCRKCDIKSINNILLDELDCCIDSAKAKELFDFSPEVDLNIGLIKNYNWILNQIKG